MFLFFYYPSDEYISYLMTVDELEFYDEIECEDLFGGKDPRERILIFQLPDYLWYALLHKQKAGLKSPAFIFY